MALAKGCEFYNKLPREGGFLDQDDTELWLMNIARNAFSLTQKKLKDYTAEERELKIEIVKELYNAPV